MLRRSAKTRLAWLSLTLVSTFAPVHKALHAKDAHHFKRVHHAASPAHTAGTMAPKAPAIGAEQTKQTEAVEAVEAVETVETTQGPVPAAAPLSGANAAHSAPKKPQEQRFLARALLLWGHLHAALVHLPIAWVFLWALLDIAGLWFGQKQFLPVGPWLGGLVLLCFVPAIVSGLLRFGELAQASADLTTMAPALVHRNLMYLAFGLCIATYLLRPGAALRAAKVRRIVYTALLIGCFVVVGFAAHLGGALVYGEEFLQF